jgi:DtxR family manganese transport transcriptional regulator
MVKANQGPVRRLPVREPRDKSIAAPFKATRHRHKTEAAEDYTELIADLISIKGEARTVEVARRLGISHVTALRTIKRLEEEGYVLTCPYAPIELTAKGEQLAQASRRRHTIVVELLLKLGVPAELAKIDAEGIEHHISEQTLKIIQKFLRAAK